MVTVRIKRRSFQHTRHPCHTIVNGQTPFTYQQRQGTHHSKANKRSLLTRSIRGYRSNTIQLSFIQRIMRHLFRNVFIGNVNSSTVRRTCFIRRSTTINSNTNFIRIRTIRTYRNLRKFRLLRRHILTYRASNNRHRIRQNRRCRTFKSRTSRTDRNKRRNKAPLTNKSNCIPATSHIRLQPSRRRTRQCSRRNRRFRSNISTLIRIKRNLFMSLHLHNRNNNVTIHTSHISLSRNRTKSHNKSKVSIITFILTRNTQFTDRRKFIRFRTPNTRSLHINKGLFTKTSPRRITRRSFIIQRFSILTITSCRVIKNCRSKGLIRHSFNFRFNSSTSTNISRSSRTRRNISP